MLSLLIYVLHMGEEGDPEQFHIGRSQGDVYGVNVSGSGNVVGKNIAVGDTYGSAIYRRISIEKRYLEKIPEEYARALIELSNIINNGIETGSIQLSLDAFQELNHHINGLAKEVISIDRNSEKNLDLSEKRRIESILLAVLENIVKSGSKREDSVQYGIVLSPFSSLIGKSVESVVKELI
jgi:hypothetical protein